MSVGRFCNNVRIEKEKFSHFALHAVIYMNVCEPLRSYTRANIHFNIAIIVGADCYIIFVEIYCFDLSIPYLWPIRKTHKKRATETITATVSSPQPGIDKKYFNSALIIRGYGHEYEFNNEKSIYKTSRTIICSCNK